MPKEEYYEKSFVAFIDILGFKNIVKESEDDIKKQEKTLKILESFKEFRDKAYEDNYGKEVSVFSDNILISYSAKNNGPGGLVFLLSDLSRIYISLLEKGYFLRGGIAYDYIYHKNDMCFGKALINAYQLESEIAVYPRIILYKEVIDEALKKEHRISNSKEEEYKGYIEPFICEGDDGYYFLDVLRFHEEDFYENGYVEFMEKVKRKIEENLEFTKCNSKVFQKYMWFARYYNSIINDELEAIESYGGNDVFGANCTYEEIEKKLIKEKKFWSNNRECKSE